MVNNISATRSNVFFALSDSSRRKMLEMLAQNPSPVSELAKPFQVSAPAISKHIKVLENAGLLRREIKGREHICHLTPQGFGEALAWFEEQQQFWQQSLEKLNSYFIKQNKEGHSDGKPRKKNCPS